MLALFMSNIVLDKKIASSREAGAGRAAKDHDGSKASDGERGYVHRRVGAGAEAGAGAAPDCA